MVQEKALYIGEAKEDFSVNNKEQSHKGTEAPHMP